MAARATPSRSPSVPIGTVVAEAIHVSRQIRQLSTVLEALKEQIRAAGVAVRGEDGERVELSSAAGVAVVTFPKAKVVIRDGAVPEALRLVLLEAEWAALFVPKVALADAAGDAWEALRGAKRKAVDRVLERKPSTPAVLLAK